MLYDTIERIVSLLYTLFSLHSFKKKVDVVVIILLSPRQIQSIDEIKVMKNIAYLYTKKSGITDEENCFEAMFCWCCCWGIDYVVLYSTIMIIYVIKYE